MSHGSQYAHKQQRKIDQIMSLLEKRDSGIQNVGRGNGV